MIGPFGGGVVTDVGATLAELQAMDLAALRRAWRRRHGTPPPRLSRDLLLRDLAYRLQADAEGGVSKATRRRLRTLAQVLRRDRPRRHGAWDTSTPRHPAGTCLARPDLSRHRDRERLHL